MSILVDKNTRVVVQGITGKQGIFHTEQMLDYGTQVVAGVRPGKGGEWATRNVPIFDTVKDAVLATGANTSFIIVPESSAADAIIEAALRAFCKDELWRNCKPSRLQSNGKPSQASRRCPARTRA